MLKVVGGTDIDVPWAFRPSVLEEHAGIKVWYRKTPIKKFNWRKLKRMPATLFVEVWTDEYGDFEPGNLWIEFDK